MEKLVEQFSVGLFFWQTVLFLALLFVLRKYAWKPILNAVKEREESIEQSIKSAEHARNEMKALQADNEKILKQAREERESILKEGRSLRDNMINEAKNVAKDEADKIIKSAREQIENEKMKAIHELKSQVADLSLEIAEKVLRSELKDGKAQRELIASSVNDAKLN